MNRKSGVKEDKRGEEEGEAGGGEKEGEEEDGGSGGEEEMTIVVRVNLSYSLQDFKHFC